MLTHTCILKPCGRFFQTAARLAADTVSNFFTTPLRFAFAGKIFAVVSIRDDGKYFSGNVWGV